MFTKKAFAKDTDILLCHSNDIKNLISELVNGKAGGIDGLPSQVLKHFSQPHYDLLAQLFQQMANNPAYKPNERPDQWNTAIVSLLAKTPQANHLDSFRPISLIPQLQKLYSKWLYSYLRLIIDQNLPPTQHGFRPRRQAAEIHHVMGKLQELGHEWRMKYIVLKVDIRKAFDTISRGAIICALRHTGAHPRLIWAISRELLANKLQPFLHGVTPQTPIVAGKGVKQGAPESGALYCLTVAHFTKETISRWDALGYGHRVGPEGELVHDVSFADDIQLIAKTPQEMAQMYSDLTNALAGLAPIGLQVNPKKTQFISNISPQQCDFLPGTNKTGQGMLVLGKLIDTTDSTDRDMARKLANAWTKFRRILPVLKQRSPLPHRLRILQACVLQAAIWGAETWHITKKRMSHLRGVHLRMLRKMLPAPGLLQGLEVGQRVIEHTRYVRDLLHSKGFDMLDKLWVKKFWSWAGHVTRLPPNCPCAHFHSFRDFRWWKHQQQNPWGQRHREYDANLSRWEGPLTKHAIGRHQWKQFAKDRFRWPKSFETFWVNLNTIWHRERSPQMRTRRTDTRTWTGQPEGVHLNDALPSQMPQQNIDAQNQNTQELEEEAPHTGLGIH